MISTGNPTSSIEGCTSSEELIVAIRSKNVGDKVRITYKRGGTLKSATLTLTASD
jgi:PDZ domain-containing secreted protein